MVHRLTHILANLIQAQLNLTCDSNNYLKEIRLELYFLVKSLIAKYNISSTLECFDCHG